jgi:hypothetical protein
LSTLRPRKAERAAVRVGARRSGRRMVVLERFSRTREHVPRPRPLAVCATTAHPTLMRPASACPGRAAEGPLGGEVTSTPVDLVMVIHWRPLQLCSCVLCTLHALASMRSMLLYRCADVGRSTQDVTAVRVQA